MLEVTLALFMASVVLMASAGAFISNVETTGSAQRQSRGALFLERVMEDLAAQDYDDLLGFDGAAVVDGATPQASSFDANVRAFVAATDLIQVEVGLVDRESGREIGRATTLRSRR